MSTLDGKKVLLVDDDNDILTSMQAAFEPTGATVDLAKDGNKAVELAEKNQPDLVVLDMMLPKRSGFLVLEKIKGREDSPLVIMVTANEGKRHQAYAESLGVDKYLLKPVPLGRLIEVAVELLDKRDAEEDAAEAEEAGQRVQPPPDGPKPGPSGKGKK
jgi:DNA-binding response OmpR family regulator